jgi:hypothetical protein
MTPRPELIYSHDYAQRLYRGSAPFSEAWQDLIYRGEVFERVYHEAISVILQSLPKVTGYAWENTELPIYLSADGANLVRPLTLRVSDDVEEMLYDLIILLARVNIQTGFTTDQQRDLVLRLVAKETAERAGLDLTDAIAADELRIRELYGMIIQPLAWDLDQQNIRHYLERKS